MTLLLFVESIIMYSPFDSSCKHNNELSFPRNNIKWFFYEGRTGLFSWCVITQFYFPWNVNLRKYCSWSVTWRFRVTRELLELIQYMRDFTTLFYVTLRRETSGRFIKTENIKRDVCIIIVTSRKVSVTTKRFPPFCSTHWIWKITYTKALSM